MPRAPPETMMFLAAVASLIGAISGLVSLLCRVGLEAVSCWSLSVYNLQLRDVTLTSHFKL
jgi:hypothetical protein